MLRNIELSGVHEHQWSIDYEKHTINNFAFGVFN